VPDISLSQLLPGTVIGKVEAADGDRGDRVTLALRGPESRYRQYLTLFYHTIKLNTHSTTPQ